MTTYNVNKPIFHSITNTGVDQTLTLPEAIGQKYFIYLSSGSGDLILDSANHPDFHTIAAGMRARVMFTESGWVVQEITGEPNYPARTKGITATSEPLLQKYLNRLRFVFWNKEIMSGTGFLQRIRGACYSPSLKMLLAVGRSSTTGYTVGYRILSDTYPFPDPSATSRFTFVQNFPGSTVSDDTYDAVWIEAWSLFIIAGGTHNNIIDSIQTSPDGVTWTSKNPSSLSTRIQHIAYSESLGMVLCANSNGFRQYYYTSDGVNWNVGTSLPTTLSSTLLGIYWDEFRSRFVAIDQSLKCAYSLDGITWTDLLTSPLGSGYVQATVNDQTGQIVATSTNGNYFYYTDDGGATWSTVRSPFYNWQLSSPYSTVYSGCRIEWIKEWGVYLASGYGTTLVQIPPPCTNIDITDYENWEVQPLMNSSRNMELDTAASFENAFYRSEYDGLIPVYVEDYDMLCLFHRGYNLNLGATEMRVLANKKFVI